MKKRVLIIVENLPVPFDRRVWQEALALRAAGYQVCVICPKGKGYNTSREDLDGISIYRHSLPLEASGLGGYILEYGAAFFWQTLLAWRIFFTKGFDVIQACNPPDNIFAVAVQFKLFGKRFIFDHHDINPELVEVKFGGRGILHKISLLLERLTFKLADTSIATNESYKKIAIERGGMTEDKVFVVRSGPDLTRLKIQPPSERFRAGKPHVVGYVGIMGAQDGIDILLRAASEVVNTHERKDIHFLLIGEGPELENMQAMANELGMGNNVHFTGYLSGDDLMEALNSIDIGVVPDEANDYNDKCTMNKIMEYMALGKPLVQFDLTEGRYSAGDAAVYAAKNDEADMARCIVELIDDPDKQKAMGAIGLERMQTRFDWKYEVPKLLQAYETALK